MEPLYRWHIYPNLDDLATRTTHAIARFAQQSIAGHGSFIMVLAGGTTPRLVYERLRDIRAKWDAWHVYFGDERCAPVDDAQRNDRMARDAWLDHVAIPPEQIHSIPAELGPDKGAAQYAETLADVDSFDLVLLGLGGDGHTASLFAGQDAGVTADAPDVIAVHNATSAPSERVSMSARRLSDSRRVMFLVTGARKREALHAWRWKKQGVPADLVQPDGGIDIFADAAAVPGWED